MLAPYLSSPLNVWWDITTNCNFKCLHCYSSSASKDVKELDTNGCKKIIDELASNKVFFVYYLGGEPFIREDFLDILDYATAKGLSTMVNTNAWFVAKDTIRHLKKLDVHRLRISLDGASPTSHDSFRGKSGAFDRVVSALQNAKSLDFDGISIVITATRNNLGEIGSIIDLVVGYGVKEVQVVPVSKTGSALQHYSDLEFGIEEHAFLKKILEENKNKYKADALIYSVDGVLDNPCTTCVKSGKIIPDFMGCRSGRTICNIDSLGNMIPCLLVRKPIFGNLLDTPLAEIWHHSTVLNKWRTKHVDQHTACVSCEYNTICLGECTNSPSHSQVAEEQRSANLSCRAKNDGLTTDSFSKIER